MDSQRLTHYRFDGAHRLYDSRQKSVEDGGQNNGFGVELVTFGWRILNDNSKEVREEDGQTGGG